MHGLCPKNHPGWFQHKTAGFLALAILLLGVFPAWCQEGNQHYSFVVFGDSRIPAYVPYDQNHQENLDQLVKKVTGYVSEDAQPDYQAEYNPDTLLLEKLELPGDSAQESRIISYGPHGWPEVFVDRKGQEARISLLAAGQEWVYDSVVQELRKGALDQKNGPGFSLHTGDIVYFGFQGKGAEESPYWQDFEQRFMSRLPKGGPGDLPARFFPTLGNHETWGDQNIKGFREMFPYLQRFGFSKESRLYSFDYHNARFMFLDSGIMDPHAPAEWYRSTPVYQEQMDQLEKWLQTAVQDGKEHVFLTFHYPVFCRSGFGPLPQEQNPHSLLESYADEIDITVFNGHVHATEAYRVDGVRYFVLGGGGGEQNLGSNQMPEDYPRDRYWQGDKRQLDYNYLLVRVRGEEVQMTLKRFRPNEMQPFQEVDLVPGRME